MAPFATAIPRQAVLVPEERMAALDRAAHARGLRADHAEIEELKARTDLAEVIRQSGVALQTTGGEVLSRTHRRAQHVWRHGVPPAHAKERPEPRRTAGR